MAAQEQGVTQPDSSLDPPVWAQALLPWIVREDRADSITGDLLEEYRESVLPKRGRSGANRWYVRQVAGILWRLSWVFAVAVALMAVARLVADTIVPPGSYQLRASLSSGGGITIYLIASAYGGWRTQRMVGGVWVALVAHVVGSLIAIAAAVGLYFVMIRSDPASLQLFRDTGDWGEAIGLPIMLTPIVIAAGVVGGFVGQLIASRRRAAKFIA